jgi:5S rRNA maturation endonuclease (ribonuclease M5)
MLEVELNEFIQKLKFCKKSIIVEGQKDKKSLESLGLKNIFTLSKKPIFEIAEEISKTADEIIILTDFDKEGKKLYGKISKELTRNGIKVDHFFREWLQKNTKLSHIEGLDSYIKNDSH